MKTLFYTACLLLVLTGYSQWQALALQVAELARQQLPQEIAGFLPQPVAAFPQHTKPGQERQISERLNNVLHALRESDSLNEARVALKQVRFVPTAKAAEAEATISYDVLKPLTMESGATLLAAACSCGVAQVRLSDDFGMMKNFKCPSLTTDKVIQH
jgi:hypothetical protein